MLVKTHCFSINRFVKAERFFYISNTIMAPPIMSTTTGYVGLHLGDISRFGRLTGTPIVAAFDRRVPFIDFACGVAATVEVDVFTCFVFDSRCLGFVCEGWSN